MDWQRQSLRFLMARRKALRREQMGIHRCTPTIEEAALVELVAAKGAMGRPWQDFFVKFARSDEFAVLCERHPEKELFAETLKVFLRELDVKHWRLGP
jgi:hypothetical protein